MRSRILTLMLVFNCFNVASTSTCALNLSPEDSGYCTIRTSCCSKEELNRLAQSSRQLLQQKLEDRVVSLRFFLHSSFASFRTFFFSTIAENESNLDELFSDTYGPFYRDNSQIFNDLFGKLKTFASGNSETTVSRITESFFDQLFRVLFTLSNPLQKLESEDVSCMQLYSYETRPFGEIEKRIKNQLENPLTFWREFLSAVDSAHQVLDGMNTISVKEECTNAMARMQTCAYCNNIGNKPCKSYCLNVLSGCSFGLAHVQKYWNNVKDALVKLASVLKEKQNIVAALTPLPISISEAVMYFQENSDFINNQLVSKCFFERNKFFHRYKRSIQHKTATVDRNFKARTLEHLKQLLTSFIQRIETDEGLFKNFPEDYCSDESSDSEGQCWNGTTVGSYNLPLATNMNPIYNPEYQNRNFVTFQGTYVEERLRFQWLEQRIQRVLSKNSDKREKRLEDDSRLNDDEDYNNDNTESSGMRSDVEIEMVPMKLLPKSEKQSIYSVLIVLFTVIML